MQRTSWTFPIARAMADVALSALRFAPPPLRTYLTLAGRLGYLPHLKKPRTFNEKLVWLLRNTKDVRRARLADKLAVKDYVARVTPEARTPRVITVAERGEDLDLTSLPDTCVPKANNGYARNLILRAPHDHHAIVRQANAWLAQDPSEGLFPWETHYREIPPRVFIEDFLSEDGHAIPRDYKVHVFHGHAVMLQFVRDEPGASVSRITMDRDWRTVRGIRSPLPWQVPLHDPHDEPPPRPPELDQLLGISETLAGDIPFVRVDAYIVKGEVFIGEITFSPWGGAVPLPFALDLALGQRLRVPVVA